MLQNIYCPNFRQAKYVCLTQQCQSSPFLCAKYKLTQQCKCQKHHKQNCNIRNAQQMTEDIKRILQFQWLVIFSKQLKGKGIQVAGRTARQYHSPPKNQRFILTFDHIPLDKPVQVTFKIASLVGCIGVGMFLKQVIIQKQFNYIPNKTNFMGHGCYMVMSNNYKYSHSQQIDSFKQVNNFNMKQGSFISLKYSDGLLTFKCDNKYAYLKIPYIKNPQLQQKQKTYHFGAYLYQIGDSIEIMRRK